MFTGIVTELGEILERVPVGKGVRFKIKAPKLSKALKVGDSVACDGVCLTVEKSTASGFSVCAVPETLSKTTLGFWKTGNGVNLESALTAAIPMGGHFVLGHVDGVCEVTAIRSFGNEGREISVRMPKEFLSYCVYKGSLCLSGISLTIASVDKDILRFAIIPHTLEITNLGKAKVGTKLNFEVDILAKYVERQLALRGSGGEITATKMESWGYGIP